MPMLEQIDELFMIEWCKREAWDLFKATHYHNCYELYYLEEGEIVYYIDDGIYPARKGDFILIPPGKMHKTLPWRSSAHSRILIYLDPRFLEQEASAFPELFKEELVLVTMGSRQVTQRLLGEMLEEDAGEKNPVMLRAILTQLLVHLSRWAKRGCDYSAESTERSGGNVECKVQEVMAYLDNHFREEISLAEMAERFYMNPTYLSRIFRRVTGMTYSEYLMQHRLREAVFLLNTTDKKVMEIAVETGFHSDNHFCKMFRKHMGVSPRRFRKGLE
ncbi:MAG: AraC family transcriptional regulator [Clostridia bacterium]|nr:AraC family transcriptional regulator [Clostridia bacterium]